MYTILAVDDAKDTLMLLKFDLVAEGYNVLSVESGEDALALVKERSVDLILLDMYMPGMSGLVTLEELKNDLTTQKLPVIMLSASNDEDEIVTALELGADDYVTKPYIAKVLLARIKTSIRLKTKSLELERLANTDFLTRLNNRGSFEDLSSSLINQCYRHDQPLVMCMCDIDYFKKVNDNYGHDAGDKVLIEFSKILRHMSRDYDAVGRIGGEEFAICMPNTTIEDAQIACERLRESIEHHQVVIEDQQAVSITVSIGLASAVNEPVSLADLLKRADDSLYQAKSNGRNCVCFLEPNHELGNTLFKKSEGSPNKFCETEQPNTEKKVVYPGIEYSVGVANVLGDDKLFKEILIMFYEDHHQDGEKLERALISNDILSAKHLAHTLKGVACSVGAMELYEVTKILDLAINNQKKEDFKLLFDDVSNELNKVIKGILHQVIN